MTDTKQPLWMLSEVAALYGAAISPSDDRPIYNVNLDSRELQPGSLFVAYRRDGGKDGHDFLPDVLTKGGAAALVERAMSCDGLPIIRVDSAISALQKLGQAARTRLNPACKIIAITGSVGKTTCRALMAEALDGFGKLHASAASLNNHWGVPLTLARIHQDAEFGVFEVGMNHADEITNLVAQIKPHVAIITTIDAAHIGNFPDGIDGIARAKAEIFSGLQPGGTAVLNTDNPQLPILEAEAAHYGVKNIIRFGKAEQADIRLISYARQEQGGLVTIRAQGREFSFLLPMRGEHNAMNALAALGAVMALGLDVERAAKAFATMNNVEGRGNIATVTLPQGGQFALVDDRHNSSPVALAAAIREFAQLPVTGRRILALGDMLELGETSAQLHSGMAPVMTGNNINLILTCGPMMEHLHNVLPAATQKTHYADSTAMAAAITGIVKNGDAVLVKGSRGAQMIHVVDALNRMGQST